MNTNNEYPNRLAYLDGELIAEVYSDFVNAQDGRNKFPRGDFMIYASDEKDVPILHLEGKKIPVKIWESIGEHGERVLNLLTIKYGVMRDADLR